MLKNGKHRCKLQKKHPQQQSQAQQWLGQQQPQQLEEHQHVQQQQQPHKQCVAQREQHHGSNSAALHSQLMKTIECIMKLLVMEAAWNQAQCVYAKVKGEFF